MARRIETLMIPGRAGMLEALLEEPESENPSEVALVCHPHPLHGGTMHNKVVYRIARGLRAAGMVVLRFNYRGVNRSEGLYDEGVGELEDARTALAFLQSRYPGLPYTMAGFSFGSRITLKLGCELGSAERLIAVGFPAGYSADTLLGRCLIPRVFIQSTHDQFGPVPAMQSYFDTLSQPKELIWVEASDHFFAGGLDPFEQAVIRSAKL